MMRLSAPRLVLPSVISALLLGLSLSPALHVQAQAKKVVCDSDLVVTLFVGENFFGFGAVTDAMMQDKSMKMVDLATIDTGQHTPLFEAMMKNMDSSMAVKGTSMSSTDMEAIGDMMDHPTDMMKGMDVSKFTTLKPAKIAGEPAECTSLRTELSEFFSAIAIHGESMAPAMSGTMSPGMSGTMAPEMGGTMSATMSK